MPDDVYRGPHNESRYTRENFYDLPVLDWRPPDPQDPPVYTLEFPDGVCLGAPGSAEDFASVCDRFIGHLRARHPGSERVEIRWARGLEDDCPALEATVIGGALDADQRRGSALPMNCDCGICEYPPALEMHSQLLGQIAEVFGVPRGFLEPGLSADAVRYQPPEGHVTPEEDMDAWFAELTELLEEEL